LLTARKLRITIIFPNGFILVTEPVSPPERVSMSVTDPAKTTLSPSDAVSTAMGLKACCSVLQSAQPSSEVVA